ncbi:MAG: glycosyltransferase [bacterium]|nr:glycosyltransferase [bacterium]
MNRLREVREALDERLRRAGIRPAPLAFETPAAAPEPDSPRGPVDVIVPVHGARAELEACCRSFFRHAHGKRQRLIVVVDGDPDFRPEWVFDERSGAQKVDVRILVNDRCRGFVASVNRGMSYSDRDVVLLNSDTVVTRGWLEKMQDAAYSAPAVGTVTPLSNHATICSLPRPLEFNELPAGYDVDRFARLVDRVAERRYPRLPTGVGMCLYIKRRVLDRVGLFDEESFGTGYGEETDFCFRALKAGYVHVLDDATFILHHGERSFGGRRRERIAAAERTLRRLHPEYVATLAAFLRADPLEDVRRRVRWALRAADSGSASPGPSPARVLHIVHGWPPYNHAGTELYAHWLATRQSREREVAVYARVADPERRLGEATEECTGKMRVRLVVNNFTQRSPLARNALASRVLETDLERFLDRVRPELVHVHHLAGHAVSLLPRVAARDLPIVYQIQDWWALCARANLCRSDRALCSGPSPGKCSSCLPLTGIPPAALWNRLLYLDRRRRIRRGLRQADVYVMGSRFIEGSYRDAGLLRPGDRVYVLPYGVILPAEPPPRPSVPARPLRFGYIGSIQPHKGVHVAVAAFRDVDPRQAVLGIWGNPAIVPAYSAELKAMASPDGVRFHGNFAERDKGRILENLDVLLLPSLGLESFGLVAREAIAHGVPVIASRRGALEELFPEAVRGGGAFFEPGGTGELRRLIAELIEHPETVRDWMREPPPVTGCEEHAAAIEQVYADVLARPR